MKHIFVRLAVAVLLVATVFSVAPKASADSEVFIEIYNGEWVFGDCSTGDYIFFDYNFYVPAGYTVREAIEITSPEIGVVTDSAEYVMSNTISGSDWWYVPVPANGSGKYFMSVVAPNGVVLSSTSAEASCVTGQIFLPYGDVYGINEPAASARVMGTVLADTPVYAEANPTTALAPVLKAGQTWFIVGEVTGTDGAQWYKVFVGGKNTGYVPASTMTPQGPVPGAK